MAYYKYLIRLILADRAKIEHIDFRLFEPEILEAKEKYNTISIGAKNPKSILSLEINKDYIQIVLSSSEALTSPSHALREFSAILVKGRLGQIAVTNKKLFRGEASPINDDTSVSPSELIRLFVELVYETKSDDQYSKETLTTITEKLMNWRNLKNAH